MEEVERVAYEKYKIINSLSTQLEREIQVEDMEKELEILRAKQLEQLKVKATAQSDDDEEDA